MVKATTPREITADFSNVGERREGGRAARVPEGDYLLEVRGCQRKWKKGESQDESPGYLTWMLAIVKPSAHKNAGFVYHNTTLKEEGLWNLRNFLEDLGLKVPTSRLKIPIEKIVAKKMQLGATLVDGEPYNDKIKSEIAATFPKEKFEEQSGDTDEDEDEDTEDEDTDTASTDSDDDDDEEELDLDDL